jgi:hypothetical protein
VPYYYNPLYASSASQDSICSLLFLCWDCVAYSRSLFLVYVLVLQQRSTQLAATVKKTGDTKQQVAKAPKNFAKKEKTESGPGFVVRYNRHKECSIHQRMSFHLFA